MLRCREVALDGRARLWTQGRCEARQRNIGRFERLRVPRRSRHACPLDHGEKEQPACLELAGTGVQEELELALRVGRRSVLMPVQIHEAEADRDGVSSGNGLPEGLRGDVGEDAASERGPLLALPLGVDVRVAAGRDGPMRAGRQVA
jgi:hypothetical protein